MLTSCSACAALIVGLPTRCPHCDALVRRGVATRASALLALAVLSAGCPQASVAVYGVPVTDDDGDGFPVEDDCDDSDPDVNPAATEAPGNGIDDDCDGVVDETAEG